MSRLHARAERRVLPSRSALGRPLARLAGRFGERPGPALLETASRFGYVARGAVYLSIGTIALLAALRLGPHAEGALGALEAWGDWPAGLALLWIVGLGLYGFAGWRALQALFDADRCGRSPRGLATRVGQAISGVTYGALAVSVFGLIDALEDLREPDDQAATRAFIEGLLELPFGPLLVMGLGLFVLAAGLGSIARAAFDHFGRDLECRTETRAWAGTLARMGYLGRGVALIPAAFLLGSAGLHARASEARGVGGALQLLAAAPFGHAILAITACGLIAFGLFAVIEAWLRPIRVPELT